MSDLVEEIKLLLIETLELEDISPQDIDPEAPLFGEGLGLDSIDALEIGVALQRRYGIKIDAKSDQVRNQFYSVSSLSKLVADGRTS